MIKTLRLGAIAAAISFTAFTWQASAQTPTQNGAFSDSQVEAIQKIMKDYLLQHPEVLLEVQEAYEKKIEAKRGEAMTSHMPMFYKALNDLKTDLAPMSTGTGDVTVIEFFDYNCGYCQKALPEVVKLLDSDKNVKVQFLEFPILSAGSQDAAKVAIAAGKQGKYFEFHKAMLAAGHASKDNAMKIAEKVGLDMDKLKTDVASPETEALITKISDLGRQIFIDGTPSFIIGDKTNPGAADFSQLKQLVDQSRQEGCKFCVSDAGTASKNDKKS